VKESTCFKNPVNPSCIDLFLTNSATSFENTTTVSTGLSDFHKMITAVLKTTFPKAKPRMLLYRDFSKYKIENFGNVVFNTAVIILWKSESPVLTVVVFSKLVALLVKNRSIQLGLTGFLKQVLSFTSCSH
jgi:hypothetical protein